METTIKNSKWAYIKDFQAEAQKYLKEVESYENLIYTTLTNVYPNKPKNIIIDTAVDIAWNELDLDDARKILES